MFVVLVISCKIAPPWFRKWICCTIHFKILNSKCCFLKNNSYLWPFWFHELYKFILHIKETFLNAGPMFRNLAWLISLLIVLILYFIISWNIYSGYNNRFDLFISEEQKSHTYKYLLLFDRILVSFVCPSWLLKRIDIYIFINILVFLIYVEICCFGFFVVVLHTIL